MFGGQTNIDCHCQSRLSSLWVRRCVLFLRANSINIFCVTHENLYTFAVTFSLGAFLLGTFCHSLPALFSKTVCKTHGLRRILVMPCRPDPHVCTLRCSSGTEYTRRILFWYVFVRYIFALADMCAGVQRERVHEAHLRADHHNLAPSNSGRARSSAVKKRYCGQVSP